MLLSMSSLLYLKNNVKNAESLRLEGSYPLRRVILSSCSGTCSMNDNNGYSCPFIGITTDSYNLYRK